MKAAINSEVNTIRGANIFLDALYYAVQSKSQTVNI
jgi:hypothetical protein